jgi:hypothetical protein
MTHHVESPLEDRLRAALAEVAERVSVDALPATSSDEEIRRAPSRRVRVFAMAALAATLAVGVALVVNGTRSSERVLITSTSTSISTPTTTTGTPAALECPEAPAKLVQPHQIAGTDTAMVPGTPTALLACRYHGLNQPEPLGSLAKSASFPPGPIATALNSQPAVPPGTRSSCPDDFGDNIFLIFAYADGSRLVILVGTSGCRYTLNGDRVIHMDPVALDQLQAVLGRDGSP